MALTGWIIGCSSCCCWGGSLLAGRVQSLHIVGLLGGGEGGFLQAIRAGDLGSRRSCRCRCTGTVHGGRLFGVAATGRGGGGWRQAGTAIMLHHTTSQPRGGGPSQWAGCCRRFPVLRAGTLVRVATLATAVRHRFGGLNPLLGTGVVATEICGAAIGGCGYIADVVVRLVGLKCGRCRFAAAAAAMGGGQLLLLHGTGANAGWMTANRRGFIACTAIHWCLLAEAKGAGSTRSTRALWLVLQLLCGLLDVRRQQLGVCGIRPDGAACLGQ